jgi:hypothetical protein
LGVGATRRLDAMPLAIKLVAAQVFSMDEIVGSLQAEDNGTSASTVQTIHADEGELCCRTTPSRADGPGQRVPRARPVASLTMIRLRGEKLRRDLVIGVEDDNRRVGREASHELRSIDLAECVDVV